MKFEVKIIVLGFVLSFLCILSFTYACSLTEKKIYAYQVGIYNEEENKNQKLAELKEQGFKGYVYNKDNKHYVLSMINENYDEIKKHSQQVKGIIKEYTVSSDVNNEMLLNHLTSGKVND